MKHWYALYCKPNQESQVDTWLRDRGTETYLPTVRRRVQRRDRPARLVYFPSYLFARVDFDVTPRSAIAWMPGIRRIVSTGEQPTIVADDLVALIRLRLEEVEVSGYSEFRPGDRVRFTAGPLRDLEAIFDRPLSAAERVRVLLKVLGRTTPVDIDLASIARV